jgi:RNA polymerase sigma-B factor
MALITAENRSEELFGRKDDDGVRDRLVERYLPLAEALARRYQHSGQPMDDLVQVACIGLIKAIDRFDHKRGTSFESYAIPTILGELKRHHRDRGWSVRMPRRLQEHALVIKEVIPLLAQDLGRSPTIGEIGAHAGLTEDEVHEALEAQHAYSGISLDAPLGDETNSSSLADTMADEDSSLEIAEQWAECEPHVLRLPERQRKLLLLRFFEDRTQSEIADELGISQMHVSRLLSRTLAYLREALAGA